MLRLLFAIILSLSTAVWGAEDSYDTYYHATECPENGPAYATSPYKSDANNFIRCQCTSYVAQKLSELMTQRYYNNGAPSGLVKSFNNTTYYMPQADRSRWSNALNWRDAALYAGIGVTGGRDNFTWDEKSYNAVFPGDVAWWDAWNRTTGQYGHVAIVEAAGKDADGLGVAWVTITEYNFSTGYEFGRRTLYKRDHPTIRFPDAFLHIDKDHAYCAANKTIDNCQALWGGVMIASSGVKADGLGGAATSFNLKINRFWVRDVATQLDLVSGGHTVRTGQALEVRLQQKAVNGNTNDYMRPGKDRVETDLYNREDSGDWRFLGREYTQAINLPKDATHTEHVVYTVPPGATEVCFKGKIDAEDEASENNEGDNWSPVACFRVDNNPTVNFITTFIGLTNTPTPVPPGSAMRARMAIRNVGTTAPSAAIRSSYSYRPLGSTGPWIQIADDGSDPSDLVPNRDHWEETLSAVTAPQVPGWYELRGCADYQNAILESNETDNCLTTTFEVAAYPDLIITYIGMGDYNDTSIRKGNTKYPTMRIKNVGTGPASVLTRQAYYLYGPATGYVWKQIDGDDTEPQYLCVNCETTEKILKGYAINSYGVHYLKACANYLRSQVEATYENNCLISAPITVK